MKVTLQLMQARPDAVAVSGVIRVDDQSEADAPARALEAHPFGPVPVGPDGRVTVSLPDNLAAPGASLNVRAEVRDASGGSARFLNTTAIPVPPVGTEAISAELDRY